MKSIFPILTIVALLSGCAALQNLPPQSAPLEVVASPTSPDFVAPTLPPEYTQTPTASPEPTQTTTPTPFTVVLVDTETPEVSQTAAIPTPAFAFTNWEQFEATRLGIAIDVPDTLRAAVLGRDVQIASPSNAEAPIPLTVELRVDAANSFRLPDGINPADPRSVLEGVLGEIESSYDMVNQIRPLTNVSVGGSSAAEAAVRTTAGTGDSADETIWYLAAIVNQETVVRVYASSPAETGGTYLAVAERITDSLEFLPEP
jgi:hypothetical protein